MSKYRTKKVLELMAVNGDEILLHSGSVIDADDLEEIVEPEKIEKLNHQTGEPTTYGFAEKINELVDAVNALTSHKGGI